MKAIFVALTVTAVVTVTLPTRGAMPVIDVSVLGQVIQEVKVATEQLEQLTLQVKRLGDPAKIKPPSAREVIRSLGKTGVGVTLDDLQSMANGFGGVTYAGQGLYQPVGEQILTADGKAFGRPVETYRKFDAITQSRMAMEAVMADTEKRRQALRTQITATVAALLVAPTMAEVQKLQAVLEAQSAELAAIDREREAALARLVAQRIENETDLERQEQARIEERIVDFQTASEKLGKFLKPDTSPVRIPAPR